jgi:hypothetical protein
MNDLRRCGPHLRARSPPASYICGQLYCHHHYCLARVAELFSLGFRIEAPRLAAVLRVSPRHDVDQTHQVFRALSRRDVFHALANNQIQTGWGPERGGRYFRRTVGVQDEGIQANASATGCEGCWDIVARAK